jgi:hypothetical protein
MTDKEIMDYLHHQFQVGIAAGKPMELVMFELEKSFREFIKTRPRRRKSIAFKILEDAFTNQSLTGHAKQ